MKMTDTELTKLICDISLKAFQRPFKHQACFNNRLKTTGGRYHLKDHHIDINPRLLADSAVLEGIIKHELVHYHLHQQGLDYHHQSSQFKALLAQVNGLRYTPSQTTVYPYQYRCQNCQQHYQRKRQINTQKYVCGHCHGQLKKLSEN